MKKKNVIGIFVGVLAVFVLSACNNYFHDLIPPDDNFILSFYVDGQLGEADISNNTVSASMEIGTNIHSIIPRVTISKKAVLLPVTFEYVSAAFPCADLINTTMNMNRTEDITSFVMDMIRDNQDFNVPALDIPIDFTGPVTMLVVSGQGNIRQYTVVLTVDNGEPRIMNFCFNKYDNAELVIDARCMINENDRIITSNALYPMDMNNLSYRLIPTFQIQGETLSIDGVDIVSGVTEVQFSQSLGSQNKIISVTRNDETKDYTLTITFAEDPDTERSITDFRFNKTGNSGIAANAVASIINTNNTGTISVQVFYSGVKTPVLTPHFISPGTVIAGGVTQISGASSFDFSSQVEYRVISKNGLYTRVYTVKVEFVSLTDGAPRITSFRFSAALNTELSQDTAGEIGDGLIMIDIRYGGTYPPTSLIPEFTAEGLVTVYGNTQVSGASPQDFVRQIKYTVTNPLNSLFTRDYWVQCRMIRDTSSDAAITAFGFFPDDNIGLADEVIGKIDHINGKITVYAPVGSGITLRTMFARFTAAGIVSVEGTTQVSGVSGKTFNTPVTYVAVSANGLNRRSYEVTVRELQTTIYVDSNAFGHGDGVSWENAFRSLKSACEAAAMFPQDVPKEIWIAAGTYKPGVTADDYLLLTANTSYIGGFSGNETAKSQRNIASNEVIISGDLGGGLRSKRLFSSSAAVNGDLSFDALQFTGASGAANGGGIYAVLDSQCVLNATSCSFNNLSVSGSGSAMYIIGGGAVIFNSTFSMCKGLSAIRLDCEGETFITGVKVEDSSALYLSGNGDKNLETVSIKRGEGVQLYNSSGGIQIKGLDIIDISGDGVSISNFRGNAEIKNINLRNASGNGIYGYNSSPESLRLSGITANAVNRSRAVNLTLTQGAIILENSNFTANGVYLKTGASNLIDVSNTTFTSVTSGEALAINGGNNASIDNVKINGVSNGDALNVTTPNAVIKNVNIDNVPKGRGMTINNNGRLDISNTVIKNCVTTGGGGGIYVGGTGNANISYTTIAGCKANNNGGGMCLVNSGNVSISNITIDTIELTGSNTHFGGGIYGISNGGLYIANSVIKNITGNNNTYCAGIYCNASANLEVSGLELQNIPGYGIYNSNGGTNYFYGITATNIGGAYGVYSYSASDGYFSLLNSVFNSCGAYCYTTGAVPVTVTNTEIRNAKGDGLSMYKGTGTVTIDHVTIDGVPNGRGININGSGRTDISNSVIKNCFTTSSGGGISIFNSNTAEISNTTIENVTASSGGGIFYSYSSKEGSEGLRINGCKFKNSIATSGGGGLYYAGSPVNTLAINNTTMELCLSEGYAGAIYTGYFDEGTATNYSITNSQFINCNAPNNSHILSSRSFKFIRGCTFTHDANHHNMVKTESGVVSAFGSGGGNFEDCTFNYLRGNMPSGQNFLFNCWGNYPSDAPSGGSGVGTISYAGHLNLKNCTFNLNSGSSGLFALYNGGVKDSVDHVDYLLLDGVTINNNGGQKPLIWLDGNKHYGSFQFKTNNTYNGLLLDTDILTRTSGVTEFLISLTSGATPVIVP